MCMQNKGVTGWLTNPISTAFGENSFVAKINKAAIDPGGAFMPGPSAVDGIVPDLVRDPLKIGDVKRENDAKVKEYNKKILASYSQGSDSSAGKTKLGA